MASVDLKIKDMEDELKKTKYNKRTQHHIGLVKAKIARLKEKRESSGGGGKGQGYHVKKSGDATVVLLGFPSVGKSTLLNAITGATSAVGAYEFTTLDVIPGTLEHRGAKIQILDVPGIVHGAATGRGRGREVLSVIRNADLVLMVVDALNPAQSDALKKEVWESKIRLNKRKPDVKIMKRARGGINIGKTVKIKIENKTIEAIMREFRVNNADIVIRDPINEDDLIDCLEANRIYIPGVTVINKIDLINEEEQEKIKKSLNPDLMISAQKNQGVNELKDLIFNSLKLMRIYLKEVGKKADMQEPLIIKTNSTIGDVCRSIHKDFVKKFKFAKVSGPSAKFDGQEFKQLTKVLHDGDIVEVHLI